MMHPIVSIVVITKNEEQHISNCIESLLAQDLERDKYEIIIVDAASTDKTQKIINKYPVKLVVDNYGTLSHQRNTGVDNSLGDYVAFTDADCVVNASWLKKLVATISNSPSEVVAVTGPNLVMDDDPPFSRIVGYMQETFLGSGGSPQSYRITKPKHNVITAPNCNAIYRRQIIAKERYDNDFHFGEDAELNYRLRRKGYRIIYLPDAIVWHHRVSGFKKFLHKMFAYGEGVGKATRKHKGLVRWYAFVPVLTILALVLGCLLIWLFSWAVYLYAFAFLAYVVGLLVSTLQIIRRYKNIKSLMAFVLLPAQHFSHCFGFMKGLLIK